VVSLKKALQSYDLQTEFVKLREMVADRNQLQPICGSKIPRATKEIPTSSRHDNWVKSSQVNNQQYFILHCAKNNRTVKNRNFSWLWCSWSSSGFSSRPVWLYVFFSSLVLFILLAHLGYPWKFLYSWGYIAVWKRSPDVFSGGCRCLFWSTRRRRVSQASIRHLTLMSTKKFTETSDEQANWKKREKSTTYSQTSRLENPEELQLHHNHEKFLFLTGLLHFSRCKIRYWWLVTWLEVHRLD
jgi:hypothetical protein